MIRNGRFVMEAKEYGNVGKKAIWFVKSLWNPPQAI
ncbi:hypothetical protein RUMTOR_02911, partial [[Ruminococcus] torques ATCC 27756]